ncbi:MAG: hypothetical protein TR69_WS6001000967 [candidate division WS6 bacterium OLB20]|uniref:SMODS and SLOG-associating 2TM effector domain-containing protein n=1 Tax=candidate division WS6 bacterium OLB20 TaxID=1617426 RepID=A0A136LZ75_9BACT|nr:MAG: hypothetical protein TR69_WS6001000967 [candidate division WS6 bacterium OLB20]
MRHDLLWGTMMENDFPGEKMLSDLVRENRNLRLGLCLMSAAAAALLGAESLLLTTTKHPELFYAGLAYAGTATVSGVVDYVTSLVPAVYERQKDELKSYVQTYAMDPRGELTDNLIVRKNIANPLLKPMLNFAARVMA